MLLCISLASRSPAVESYIAEHSNFLPILASGLSGLYSALPRALGADHPAWHRLDPGDTQVGREGNWPSPGNHQTTMIPAPDHQPSPLAIHRHNAIHYSNSCRQDVPGLAAILTSLELCSAVVEVAPSQVARQPLYCS